MWTAENRGNYERAAARYPSDVTDEEWALIEPHLGPERETCRRELLNAILYVLTTGCQWRQLPKDLPPKSTVHDYFVNGSAMARCCASITLCMRKRASLPARRRARPRRWSTARA